jgi:glycerophosphoryl diester phosphodiesterase
VLSGNTVRIARYGWPVTIDRSASPRIFAHRGASGYRPEHTRSSYVLALEMGAEAIELDLVPTRDGILVVRHENELSKTTNIADHPEFADRYATKKVDGRTRSGFFAEDFTWAEITTLLCRERFSRMRGANATANDTEPILSLTDVLAFWDENDLADVSLVLELKDANYFDEQGLPLDVLLKKTLREAGWEADDPRIIVECFQKTILLRMRESGIGSRHIYLMEFGGVAWDEVKWAAEQGVPSLAYIDELSDAGLEALGGSFDGLGLDARFLVDVFTGGIDAGKKLVEAAHGQGLTVFAWTLRPENRFLPLKWHVGLDQFAWGNWQGYFASIYSLGVDGIFADHPDLAITARESVSARP